MQVKRFANGFVAALLLISSTVCAAQYPERPITLIVPFPPGGTTDILFRPLAQELAKELGQPVIVENKPGAGSNLGATVAARSDADGYTLFAGSVHNAIAMSVYNDLRYDLQKDFDTVAIYATVPHVLIVNKSSPIRSVQDLIDSAKKKPGSLSFASGGVGTSHHIIGEMFNKAAGVDVLHVPYKGGVPAVADLIGGRIDIMFETSASALSYIRADRVNAIAVTTKERSAVLPDLPTVDEGPLPGFDARTWYGIMAPAGTPADVVQTLNAAVLKVQELQQLKSQLAEQGATSMPVSPAEADAFVAAEIEKWGSAARAANVGNL